MLPEPLTQQAEKIVRLYTERRLMLATAESCTGGLIAACITAIPGSSAVLERGFVTYSNKAKIEEIGVPEPLIADKGAVSEEIAAAMAKGARAAAGTDIAVAVTGIAGPGGGSEEKPVGLVYIGLATRTGNDVRRYLFKGDRTSVREQAALKALSWLYAAAKEI